MFSDSDLYDDVRKLFSPFEQPLSEIAVCEKCLLFVGSEEQPYSTKYPCSVRCGLRAQFSTRTAHSTSQSWQQQRIFLKTALTKRVNRLSFLPFLLQRWKGWNRSERLRDRGYSIAVLTHAKEVKQTVELITSLRLPSRIRIVLYIPQKNSKETSDYPVNKLRNIAIVNIVTTHFLVMDMDMWPARSPFLLFRF